MKSTVKTTVQQLSSLLKEIAS